MPKRQDLTKPGWLSNNFTRGVAVEIAPRDVVGTKAVALGRNGVATVTGLVIHDHSYNGWVMLQPTNTAGETLRCYITIPDSAMDKLAFLWLKYRGLLPEGGDNA